MIGHSINLIIRGFICFILLSLVMAASAWAAPEATAARAGAFEGNERFVLELSGPVTYRYFTLDRPLRLVIDMPSIVWGVGKSDISGGRAIKDVRHGAFRRDQSRVVLDLTQPVQVVRHELIPPRDGNPRYRLVLDLAPLSGKRWSAFDAVEAEQVEVPAASSKPVTPSPVSKPSPFKPLVVIDSGHGGDDPGARGRTGTWEKYITLRYASALRDALLATGQYRVQLTRDDDRFLKLRHRVSIGRKAGANLFISLHADSSPNPDTRGLSVYTLSDRASDEEAAALASRENKVDILSDIDLSDKDEDVASILIDLAQRETKNKSSEFAETLVDEFAREINLVRNSHRFAGFAVLKAPDVPSVLVELGFLSNRKDEALLNSTDYRKKVIRGFVRAVDSYFDKQKKR
ncbi:MAG: N-acetylmuramoyl-L-alanine amidase [Alphaproteobacteria bacterium]|nr:N-acetylmuramoyl-L-alanine amidase [Alphaproteobacteria bacterium]